MNQDSAERVSDVEFSESGEEDGSSWCQTLQTGRGE